MAALKNQTLSKASWSLLIVDNGSTTPVITHLDISWHPNSRIISEPQVGTAFARLRGIAETHSDLLVFVDDDNLLEPDYLNQALILADSWPQLGVWGCSIVPDFEITPPEHLRPYLKFLALRELQTSRWSNIWNCSSAEPWGAGLCLRRQVADAYNEAFYGPRLRIKGRTGGILMSGEDTEIAYVSCSLGLGMGIFPNLRLVHIIAKHRLNDDYLVKMVEGLNTSSMLLFYKWGGISPESPYSLRALGRILKTFLKKRGMDRRLSFAVYRAKLTARAIIAKYERENHVNSPPPFKHML